MAFTRISQYSAEARVTSDYYNLANKASTSNTQAKTGTYSYAMVLGSGAFGASFSSIDTLRMGYWFRRHDERHGSNQVLYWSANGLGATTASNHIYLEGNTASGEARLRRPVDTNTWETLATFVMPAGFSLLNTWMHVGITHKIHATLGYFSLYLDGNLVFNYTGDTRPTHWDGVVQVPNTGMTFALGLGALSTSGFAGWYGVYLDDFYIDNASGEADAAPPALRFLPAFPDGPGADNAWTIIGGSPTNWQSVDDNPNDGDTTYNKALVANLRDTFTFSNITLPSDHVIRAVLPHVFAKRLDTATDVKISVHAYDGVSYGDSADLLLAMDYSIPRFARFTTQPDASGWNEADFNTMQFGYRSRGTFA